MTVVMTIYYKETTGDIVSYQEGGAIPPASETPEGCKALNLGGLVRILDENNFRLNMKVDPATLYLIPINPVPVLTENPPSMGNPTPINGDPNAVIRIQE